MNSSITNNDIQYLENQINQMAQSISGLGIYAGQTGLAMAYFLLSRYIHQEENEKKGQYYLSQVCNHIGEINNSSFSNGLCGIGWGIEWMGQQGFLPVNTDVILKDFDDFLYKLITFQKSASITLENGTLGKSLYFYQRLISPTSQLHPYENIAHQECLILATDEIKNYLFEEEEGIITHCPDLSTFSETETKEIARCFILCYYVYKIRLNTEIMNDIIIRLKKWIEQTLFPSSTIQYHHLWLIYAYEYLAGKTGDKNMQTQIYEFKEKHWSSITLPDEPFIYQQFYQTPPPVSNSPLKLWDVNVLLAPELIFWSA